MNPSKSVRVEAGMKIDAPCFFNIQKSSWGTSSVTQYIENRQVGKGTYGEVFLGENASTHEVVALKKVSNDKKNRYRGLPLNALREIRLLKTSRCSHANIVKLLDVAAQVGDEEDSNENFFLYLVFEYVEHDLAGVLKSKIHDFSVPEVKCLLKQLLSALEHLHEQDICHRDLKCSNLLLSANYVLKLADFGLAREIRDSDSRVLSLNVITLWYRPPEILLGDTHYSKIVDMWSVGCILVELLKGSALFTGKEEMDQLRKIFTICGLPPTRLSGLPFMAKLGPISVSTEQTLAQYLDSKELDVEGCNLAKQLLELDPTRRCTAKQALQSQFIGLNCPRPESLTPIRSSTSLHEWETKNLRREKDVAAAMISITVMEEKSLSVEDERPSQNGGSSIHSDRKQDRGNSQRERRRSPHANNRTKRNRSRSPSRRH